MPNDLDGHSEMFFPHTGKYEEFLSGHSLYFQHKNGDYLGHINWHPHTGEVLSVRVKQDYRRQGVGTKLWQRAHHLSAENGLTPPRHSDLRTDLGQAWSDSLDSDDHSRMGN
jgi:GNAT superfamily N-acetyltransferase